LAVLIPIIDTGEMKFTAPEKWRKSKNESKHKYKSLRIKETLVTVKNWPFPCLMMAVLKHIALQYVLYHQNPLYFNVWVCNNKLTINGPIFWATCSWMRPG
jgi:hypothetical protein